tara:strand:- start:1454 stop:1648 length:195 start_codon:yes stop_codon:yes gene_type:complete
LKDRSGNTVTPAAICEIYANIKLTGTLVSSSTSFVIIAINLILKKIVINLLTDVKQATRSAMFS